MHSYAPCFTPLYTQVQQHELSPLGAVSSPIISVRLSIKILLLDPNAVPPLSPHLHPLHISLLNTCTQHLIALLGRWLTVISNCFLSREYKPLNKQGLISTQLGVDTLGLELASDEYKRSLRHRPC